MALLINIFDKMNYESDESSYNLSKTIHLNELEDLLNSFPFKNPKNEIKKENGSIPKFINAKRKRKEKEDNIRKKIKAGFHKAIRKNINERIKEFGSKYLLSPFPLSFICDISKETNFEIMQLTYEQLFDYTFNKYKNIGGKEYIIKKREAAEKHYNKNTEALKYLNSNKKISEESGWEKIKNMKYMDLLKAYFNSNEFEQNIEKLSKKETTVYINAYINCSYTYVDYFLSYKPIKSNKTKNDNNTNCHSLNTANLASIFTSIFKNEEDEENEVRESFSSLLNFDNEFSKTNSLFSDEYFLLKENVNN